MYILEGNDIELQLAPYNYANKPMGMDPVSSHLLSKYKLRTACLFTRVYSSLKAENISSSLFSPPRH